MALVRRDREKWKKPDAPAAGAPLAAVTRRGKSVVLSMLPLSRMPIEAVAALWMWMKHSATSTTFDITTQCCQGRVRGGGASSGQWANGRSDVGLQLQEQQKRLNCVKCANHLYTMSRLDPAHHSNTQAHLYALIETYSASRLETSHFI